MTTRSRALITVLAFALASLPGLALADGTIGFEGKRTKGTTGDRFGTLSFSVTVPRDAASGLPTGRRQYKPVCVMRTPQASTTAFLQNLATNEGFKSVTIESSNGLRIRLTNATAASYQYLQEKELEELCFSFQTIEVSVKGGAAFTDTLGGAAN